MSKALSIFVLALAASAAHAGEKTNDQLCQRYNVLHPKSIRAELEKRGALTAEEWKAVDEERIFVGMSGTAVRCARGKPWIVVTQTEAGPVEVWRYQPQHFWERLTMRDGRVSEYTKSYLE